MQRKMVGLFAALVAFGAFALVPAISSAHGLGDTSGGLTTKLAVGSKIVAYNEPGTAPTLTGSNGLVIECSESTMTGTVHANPDTAAGAVLGTIEDVWFRGSREGTACFNKTNGVSATVSLPGLTNEGGKQHWCVKTTPETDKFNVEPRNCTEASGGVFTFVLTTFGLTCKFSRSENIAGTFSTTAGTHTAATLTMTNEQEFKLEEGSFLCPASGKLSNFQYELFTDLGATGPEYRNAASVAAPVWVT